MYLAAASFSETCQRLCSPSEWQEDESPGPWAWRGFLGATDTLLGPLFEELRSECRQRRLQGSSLRSWIGRRIERRNVAGLADASKQNLFPADQDALLGLASRYGLDLATARARKSRLRSPASFSEACDRASGIEAGR
jgi:hypothetical protein